MLQRIIHPAGLATWQSPLLASLGVRHAFSTRLGGVSSGPFATLNLGNPGGAPQEDPLENLRENYRRLEQAIGCPPHTRRAWVMQVHGRRVELISSEPENEYAETLEAEIRDRFSGQLSADAMVCSVPGVLLTIRTADCVPILLASSGGAIVAAIHAGWRGITGGVIAKTIRTLHETGASPDQLRAAIGPAISAEHFEVGEEVAAEFLRQNLAPAVLPATNSRPKPHIDLPLAAAIQLQSAGIAAAHIDTNTLCTFAGAQDFFSHRRDHGTTGRMAAVIMPSTQQNP